VGSPRRELSCFDNRAEELASRIAELENVLAGKEPPTGPQTGELFRPEVVEKTDTTKLPAVVMRHIQ